MIASDPRHGTHRGYRVHREDGEQPCEPCRAAWYRYNKHATYLRQTGNPRRVPALGAHRRIRALMALGYGLPTLAGELGIATGNLSYKLHQPYVLRGTHDAIDALFEHLAMKPPPEGWVAQRTRNIARKKGWAPPLAYDDIDDPDEQPTGHVTTLTAAEARTIHRAETLADLDQRGAGISEACRVLGVSREAVEKWCARHDRRELYAALVGREHVGSSNKWTTERSA